MHAVDERITISHQAQLGTRFYSFRLAAREGGREIGEAFALGVGVEAADGVGGKLYGLAKLAEGLAAGADTHTAVREDGTGRIEVVEHVTTGVEAGFEVGGGGFSRGGGGRVFLHWVGSGGRK